MPRMKKKRRQSGGSANSNTGKIFEILDEGAEFSQCRPDRCFVADVTSTETVKTCRTMKELNKIRRRWNKEHPNHNIARRDSKEELFEYMSQTFNQFGACANNSCFKLPCDMIVSQKPTWPTKWFENPMEWLSNIDIDHVLHAYSQLWDHYSHVGTVSIDFSKPSCCDGACVSYELCPKIFTKNKLQGIIRETPCWSVVFNTAPTKEGGDHWTALFADFRDTENHESCVYFFDSTGNKPQAEVLELIERIDKNTEGYHQTFKHNTYKHQKKNTECGIYAIHFIIRMLHGVPFESFVREYMPDDQMNKLRSYLFHKN